ncbi:MAG: hypothetical protein ACJAT3_001178, partial [Akkermansiaceae bacterium]
FVGKYLRFCFPVEESLGGRDIPEILSRIFG